MLADVSSQFVILLFLELSRRYLSTSFTFHSFIFYFTLEYLLYDGGVVKETVDVSADAMVCLKDGFVSVADALMDFVALTFVAVEQEVYLARSLLCRHRGVDRQEAKPREAGYRSLDTFGIADGLSEHLVTTTDANDHLAVAMGTLDGLCTAVASQLHEVVQRSFRARQNDDIGTAEIVDVVRVEKVNTRIALQDVKVGEVGDVAQEHDGDGYAPNLTRNRGESFFLQSDRIFFIYIDVFEIRDYAEDGHAADLFQHFSALVEKAKVTTELIDDDSLDTLLILGCL